MTIQETIPNVQAIRRVNDDDNNDNTTTTTTEETAAAASASRVFHLPYYPDATSGKDIVLWEDIRAAFDDVLHVRAGSIILPFLKGPDFKNLDPLRIAAVPSVTLDVVVRGPLRERELSLESLQEALPDTPQESVKAPASTMTTTTKATTAKLNPAGGLVEAAMENYTHMDKPAGVKTPPPSYRGPQTAPGAQESSPVTTENEPTGEGKLAAEPQEDVTPQKEDAPKKVDVLQEAEAPPKRNPTFKQRFAEAELKARLGDMYAQFALGEMYDLGQGTVQSASQACEWYEKAAIQGIIVARYIIGMRYRNGPGVTNDNRSAFYWLALAAKNGHADAQYEVGLMTSQKLRPVNFDSTFKSSVSYWYQKAADQGHVVARYNLGDMYYTGKGEVKDYSKAFDLYLQAANQGHVSASNCVGNMYCVGHGVGQDYS
ncbi:MAG: hypothetical protein J3R72DRAFT_450409, partial [Linnemannia gamsii]